MKGLKTLIRLQKNKLDELRMVIVKIEEKRQECVDKIERMQKELDDEMAQAQAQAHLSQFFGDFQKRIKYQQNIEKDNIVRHDRQIFGLKQQMQEVFAELKKLEIAEQNAKDAAKKKAATREQNELDEIAGQAHSRKQGDQ